MKCKKVMALMMATVLTAGMLGGCGNKTEAPAETPAQTETPAETDADAPAETEAPAEGASHEMPTDPITIRVVSQMGGGDGNTEKFQKICDDFMAEYPNVTIQNDSAFGDQDFKVQVAADFALDNEPDIVQYWTDANASDVLAANKFVTLEELKAYNPEIAKNTSDIALEATKSPVDGVNYAIPTTGYWEGLFCNKDLFDEYNVELPTDWASLVEAIKVFKENDIVPIAVALNITPNYWIEHLMLSASGVDEFAQIPETAPEGWTKGISLFKELRDMGAFPVDVDTIAEDISSNMFKEKKAAMQLDGSWFLNSIPDQENTVVIPFPGVEGSKVDFSTTGIAGISTGFYVTKQAWEDEARKEAVSRFVQACTNDEAVISYWSGSGICTVPVPADGDFSPLQKMGADFSSKLTPVAPTDARIKQAAWTAFTKTIVPISAGTKNAEDAINEMLEMDAKERATEETAAE